MAQARLRLRAADWMWPCPLPYSIGESMFSLIQFRGSSLQRSRFVTLPLAGVLLGGLLLLSPSGVRAQGTQLSPVGQIEGSDISVQGPSAPGTDNERAGQGILVGNGAVVIVHAGQAHLALLTGGEVDICGPAKFTLLESGGAVTLAVELGRMHVQLPATATLRLFTPTIVATPLEISGASREITVGLDQDDSLCVLATSGAIQLEHQFSGEKLIVPQSGEFFLNSGKLLPVVGKAGSCQCAAMPVRPLIPDSTEPLQHTGNVPPLTAPLPPPAVQPTGNATAAAATTAPPSVEFSVPAHANEAHPLAPAEKNAALPVAPPATSIPTYTVVAPPLTFSASSPTPPPEPPIDTFLLVREAQVQPNWEFKGHVDAPAFADAMQRALGERTVPSQPPAEPRKKSTGFWGFWRKIF